MATGWSAILGRSQANSNNPPMAKKSSSRIHPTPLLGLFLGWKEPVRSGRSNSWVNVGRDYHGVR